MGLRVNLGGKFNVIDRLRQIHMLGCMDRPTIIIVTHEEDIVSYTKRTIYLSDGCIVNEKIR
jgi:ABC-type lipoprotein export system ATPase subunit